MLQSIKELKEILNLIKINNTKLLYVGFLILITMIFETLSIGILIPVVDSILIDEPNNFIKIIFDTLNITYSSKFDLLIKISFLLIIFFFIKICILIYINWYQTNFLVQLRILLSRQIYHKYTSINYEDSLNNNSSTILRDLNNESEKTVGIIKNSLIVVTEFLIIIGIISLLFLVDKEITLLSLLIMFSCIYFMIKILQNKLFKWGSERIIVDQKKNKSIQDSFFGFKEIIISKSIKFFYDKFDKFQVKSAQLNGYRIFVQTLPRLWIEFVIICVFSIIIFVLKNNSIDHLIKILSLFLISCLRLMPSINKIVTQIQGIKFFIPSVNRVSSILTNFENINTYSVKKSENNFLFQHLEFKNVTFFYNNNKKNKVLNNFSIKIKKGDCIGIYGKSGSGKSTFINLLSNLLSPKLGNIFVNGNDIAKSAIQRKIGYVSQNTFIFEDSISENIIFGRNMLFKKKFDSQMKQALKLSNLDEYINNLETGLDFKLKENGSNLSGGQKQRIGIARALLLDPQILIFDEATSSLDEKTSSNIMKEIYRLKKKKTLLIISHNTKNLYNCDYVLKFGSKKITINKK